MRIPTLLATTALLLSPLTAVHASDNVRGDLYVAQAMTGGAGSNSPAAAARPRTEMAPGPDADDATGAKRTSKDNGTGNPVAGDELDQARPHADARRDGSATAPGGAPAAAPNPSR